MNRILKDRQFSEAASWAADRERLRERSHRRAWILTWLFAAVAVVEGLALIGLAPLKTVVPYTILVDRQTGFVTTLDPARPAALGSDEALIRSMLVQYVTAREGFSIATIRPDYRRVMSWSAAGARDSYARRMTAANPENPLSLYPRSATVEVQPKSVSELADGSALVRFDLVQSDGQGQLTPLGLYAAVIRYRFAPRQMTAEERFINPLGFEVSHYRRDAEAAPAPVATLQQPRSTSPLDTAGAGQ
jgi:type IV secretion system protein VirB8